MNHTQIPIHQSPVATWEFLMESQADNCTDALEEVEDICAGLFDSFGTFVVPLRVQFMLQILSEGASVPHPSEGPPANVREIDIRNDGGIDLDELLESFQVEIDEAAYVRELPFTRNKVKLRLSSGDTYVDRSSGSVAYNRGDSSPGDVRHDPLTVRLLHAPFDADGLSTEFIYCLRVQSHTNIWFEEDESGHINRRRLSDLLDRLQTNLPVEMIDRRSEQYPAIRLEEIY